MRGLFSIYAHDLQYSIAAFSVKNDYKAKALDSLSSIAHTLALLNDYESSGLAQALCDIHLDLHKQARKLFPIYPMANSKISHKKASELLEKADKWERVNIYMEAK